MRPIPESGWQNALRTLFVRTRFGKADGQNGYKPTEDSPVLARARRGCDYTAGVLTARAILHLQILRAATVQGTHAPVKWDTLYS
jgi:hypothetical protein